MNINPNWDTTLWGCCLRVIGLLLAGLAIISLLRLCAWADTGSRGEAPIEEHIIPR
jgi:hypothetical protein